MEEYNVSCDRTIDKEYEDAKKYLKTSLMFNLSLSSNELFHSNFLYWIWKSNPDAFKKIINRLIGEEDWWEKNCENNSENNCKNKQIEVRREYKNFDLSIVEVINNNDANVAHEDSDAGDYKTDGLILFVLENKVKSIPYAQQLKKYKDKIDEHNGSILKGEIKKDGKKYSRKEFKKKLDAALEALPLRKVLLSLSDTFPDVKFDESNQFEGWKRKSYDDYLEILSKLNIEQDFKVYLEEYCDYVKHLIVCVKEWDRSTDLTKDYNEQAFGDYKYLTDAEELRMHAFYYMFNTAKLCCMLISKLSKELKNEKKVQLQYFGNEDDSILLSDKYKEKYSNYFNDKDILVGVGYDYSHQQPILEVKVAKKTEKTDERIFYIIQIQGEKYEHGIIKKCIRTVLEKKIGKYKKWVTKIPLYSSNPDLFSSIDVFPNEANKYNGYNATYSMVYKYRKLKSEASVKDVLNQVVCDVKALIAMLRKK